MDTEMREWSTPSADGTDIGLRSLGSGPDLVVVGGALRSGEDYLPLARSLAPHFRVHVMDRRGHGSSGPQGPRYGMDREVEDLTAVREATGAGRVVAHSFGGLVALEAARTAGGFTELVLYEPGVALVGEGAMQFDWLDPCADLLARGRPARAFAAFVRGSGQAPPVVRRLPLWYLALVVPLAMGRRSWRRVVPVLPTLVPEHREVARLAGSYPGYAGVAARTLVLAGGRSPAFVTAAMTALAGAMPHAELRVLDGLDHLAPDEHDPERVAREALSFLVPAASAS